jgi:chorismate dehydratase
VEPIRIGAVSYLNTKPFVYGLTHAPNRPDIFLTSDYPAAVAEQLLSKKIDIGLIPVAALQRIPGARVVSDYCIGSTGTVASVAIFSQVPLEQVTTLLLDYQSNTSVALAQILLRDYWRLHPNLVPAAGADFLGKIQGTTAAVVIGDRALELYPSFPYRYDLGEAWTIHTGLPFVFAVWAAIEPLPTSFIDSFNRALLWGVEHWRDLLPELPIHPYDPEVYFTQNISFTLDEHKKKGMQLFMENLSLLTSK